jgi:hypothetical protein
MEPEGSLPYWQVDATCPYPEPTPSSPKDPLQLPHLVIKRSRHEVDNWTTSNAEVKNEGSETSTK